MSYVLGVIYTKKRLDDYHLASEYFNLLQRLNISLDKIGLYDPLKLQFNKEQAIELWLSEIPGCYEDGLGMIGKAGNLIGKTNQSIFRFDVQWWIHPNKKMNNYIAYQIKQKHFYKHKTIYEQLFLNTIKLFDGFYGYLSHDKAISRQHVTGTIETRIPGIFWLNYFGKEIIQVLKEEKIVCVLWEKKELFYDGVIAYLANNPKLLIEDNDYEKNAYKIIGNLDLINKYTYRGNE